MTDNRLKELKDGSTIINQKALCKDIEKLWWDQYFPQFTFWDKSFTKPVDKYNKISLCTNVMDRLYDLKQILLLFL